MSCAATHSCQKCTEVCFEAKAVQIAQTGNLPPPKYFKPELKEPLLVVKAWSLVQAKGCGKLRHWCRSATFQYFSRLGLSSSLQC